MNGFHLMISDHIKETWDMALRHCKCRTKFVNLIYDLYIRRINNDYHTKEWKSKRKSERIKQLMKKNFSDIIPFDEYYLKDKDSYKYWENIDKWIKWFSKRNLYIDDELKSCRRKNYSFDTAVACIANGYCGGDFDLATYILKYKKYEQ